MMEHVYDVLNTTDSNGSMWNTTDLWDVANDTMKGPKEPSVGIVMLHICLILFLCGSNGLVILVVAKTRALQTVTNACVVNLALADLIIGLHSIPHILNEVAPELVNTYTWCCLRMGGIICMCFVSMATLTAISVERAIGILKPLHHQAWVTRNRGIMVIAVTWVCGAANALPMFIGANTWQPGMTCLILYVLPDAYLHFVISEILIFTVIITVLYSLILREIRQHQLRLKVHKTASTSGESNSEMSMIDHIRLVKAFAIVVGIFSLCWLPFCILVEVALQMSDEFIRNPMFLLVYKAVLSLVYVNSAANPIIYAVRIPAFRNAFKQTLCCCTCSKGDGAELVSANPPSGSSQTSQTSQNSQSSTTSAV